MSRKKNKDIKSLKQVPLPCFKAREAAWFLGIPMQLLWELKAANRIPYFQLRPGCEIWYPVIGIIAWDKNSRGNNKTGAI